MTHGALLVLPEQMRPSFLNQAMWWVWLLRSDIRGGAGIEDSEAQREFCAWWLLYGRQEYPAIWGADAVQIEPAMESVPVGRTDLALPRLLRRLHAGRADLQAAFPLTDGDAVGAFCAWYLVHGTQELPASPPLPPEFLGRAAGLADGVRQDAASLRATRPDLVALFDISTPAGRQRLNGWFAASGAGLLPPPALPPPSWQPLTAAERRRSWSGSWEYGVNLVGFARAEFGVGEDVRMFATALHGAEVPFRVVDVLPSGSRVRREDRTLDDAMADDLHYPITLVCMTGFDTAALLLTGGGPLLRAPITIGCWPWELARFPATWRDVYALVDEIWAASAYSAGAFEADQALPVRLIPPVVQLPPELPGPADDAGRKAGLWVAVCPFDPNSYLARKNPAGAVRAFRLAFPCEPDVRLVLRANGDPTTAPGWDALEDAIGGDPRIVRSFGTLDRAEALNLLARADAMISLHRAEGFGRNIAEAILLGVPVLATGFSGCLDFLEPAERVAWQPRRIACDDYPFGEGQSWAEPDIAQAAEKLRQLRLAPGKPQEEYRARAARFTERHGVRTVSGLIGSRIAAAFKTLG